LDEKVPGWHSRVVWFAVDVRFPGTCPLGQAFCCFYCGRVALGLSSDEAIGLGFDGNQDEVDALTRLWRFVVRARQQAVFYVHRDESGVDLAYMVTGSGDVWCWSEKHGWHRSVFKNLCTCDEGSRAHFADHLDVVSVEQLPAGAR